MKYGIIPSTKIHEIHFPIYHCSNKKCYSHPFTFLYMIEVTMELCYFGVCIHLGVLRNMLACRQTIRNGFGISKCLKH